MFIGPSIGASPQFGGDVVTRGNNLGREAGAELRSCRASSPPAVRRQPAPSLARTILTRQPTAQTPSCAAARSLLV